MQSIILVFFAAALASVGQMLLKILAVRIDLSWGTDFLYKLFSILKEPVFYIAFLLYGISSVVVLFLLKKTEVSLLYPVFLGFSVLIILGGGILFFKEALSILKIVGLALIITGVFIAWFHG